MDNKNIKIGEHSSSPENLMPEGYHMPAEYEPHEGTLMFWPVRPGTFGKNRENAIKAFLSIFRAVTESEMLYLLCDREHLAEAEERIRADARIAMDRVRIIPMESDDAWVRDTGPTFVKNLKGKRLGISWNFNAWGGTVNGLYASWEKDNLVAEEVCRKLGVPFVSAGPFVLEGGSIHSDGDGTLLVTSSCLLSPGRNPDLSRNEIEENLKKYLGAEKVLWLPRGIFNDETDEHVDNVCAFAAPGVVFLAVSDNPEDPQYALSRADEEFLHEETDAKGRKFQIIRLPVPDVPVTFTEEELDNYEFEEGEDTREAGERLAASYVNFYYTDKALLVPQFGAGNEKSDERALRILEQAAWEFHPGRKVIPIPARSLILGGGNIHCLTQQVPK